MPSFLNLLLHSACRSNHHRLALLALARLEGETGAQWRDVFLAHYEAYFAGAKAPDEVFKDFKNHVLHVRDGFWGGAPQAAAQWYARTVTALRAQDWPVAAYNGGVMSHYLVDPIHPFHTAQTEAENIIHRAVEWSFSKDFHTLHSVLEIELGGYPDVKLADGADWLGDSLRAGAVYANGFYDEIIDHYDFERGRKRPAEGLDATLRSIAAGLIGYASQLLARVLERAFEEAAVQAPKVDLVMPAIIALTKAPARAAGSAIDNFGEARKIGAMHKEYRKTGKVRVTLPADDQAVRALYAQEILNTPLSSLDCEWPREIGKAHGELSAKHESLAHFQQKCRRGFVSENAQDHLGIASNPVKSGLDFADDVIDATPLPAPIAAKASPPAQPATAAPPARAGLNTQRDVVDAPSIGPKTAQRFKAIGVHTIADLLALDAHDAAKRLHASHINARIVRDWQDQAALACAVPGLSSAAAQLLIGADIRTRADLAAAEAENLAARIAQFARTDEGGRALRNAPPPGIEAVRAWIDLAAATQDHNQSQAA